MTQGRSRSRQKGKNNGEHGDEKEAWSACPASSRRGEGREWNNALPREKKSLVARALQARGRRPLRHSGTSRERWPKDQKDQVYPFVEGFGASLKFKTPKGKEA